MDFQILDCCGIFEIGGIQNGRPVANNIRHKWLPLTVKDVLTEVGQFLEEDGRYYADDYYGEYNTAKHHWRRGVAVFSDNDQKTGAALAAEIKKLKFGTTKKVKRINDNTGATITVYLWNINLKNYRKWWLTNNKK